MQTTNIKENNASARLGTVLHNGTHNNNNTAKLRSAIAVKSMFSVCPIKEEPAAWYTHKIHLKNNTEELQI